jgi:tRNA threonylcarbamoyladenosine biosynthesis protein TsaB
MTMLLAIDTATRLLSIAIHDGDNLLAEQSWHCNNRHTVELPPAIQTMLAAVGIAIADLTALAVSIGPGSYTGLRIGVSLAKGMAAARSLPLVGVTTLDTLAAGQPYYQSGSGLITVVQAGRGRIIIKTYRWRKGRWNSHAEPRLMDWDTLLESVDGPAHITGEIDEGGMEMIAAAQGNGLPVTVAPAAHRLRRAGYMAECAWELLNEVGDDKSAFHPAQLLPIYVKSDD